MRGRWWDRPAVPYLVLLMTPAVTLPLSALLLGTIPECGIDEGWWKRDNFEIALLPARANFTPLAWLFSRAEGVKKSATIAGLAGSVQYAIVQGLTLMVAASSGGQNSNPDCNVSGFFVAAVLLPLLLAEWLSSAVLIGLFFATRRKSSSHSG